MLSRKDRLKQIWFAWPATIIGFAGAVANAASLSISLLRPNSDPVRPGRPFELEIRADFDAPLVGIAFALEADAGPPATIVARSADPADDNGLTYLSAMSQVPFEDELPHSFAAGPRREVLYDAEFGGTPGGPEDGIPAGDDARIAILTLVADEEGLLTITLNDLHAATHSSGGQPQLFDKTTIAVGSVKILVSTSPPACEGDANGDQNVDPLDAGFVLARLGCPVSQGDATCDDSDVNSDGIVDPLDVGFVLARFGACQQASARQ